MGDGERDREIYEADRDGERESGKKRKVGAERGLEAQEESESESKSDLRAREAASASCFVAAAGAGNALLAMAPGSNLQASQPKKASTQALHSTHMPCATCHIPRVVVVCHMPCAMSFHAMFDSTGHTMAYHVTGGHHARKQNWHAGNTCFVLRAIRLFDCLTPRVYFVGHRWGIPHIKCHDTPSHAGPCNDMLRHPMPCYPSSSTATGGGSTTVRRLPRPGQRRGRKGRGRGMDMDIQWPYGHAQRYG